MSTRAAKSLFLAALLSAAPAFAESTEWAIDNAHSRVAFSVPHMVISEVDGQFKTFQGKVVLDEKDVTKSQVEFTIDAASINTDNDDRDKHLKSPDFFDVQKFPKLSFKSTKISKAGKGYKLQGELTIHGVTKQVTLDATLSEPIQNPWGKQVRAVKVSGAIKREDYGLTWNKPLDKGAGLLVGSEVKLAIKLELNK